MKTSANPVREAQENTMREGNSLTVILAGVTDMYLVKQMMLDGGLIPMLEIHIRNMTTIQNLVWNQYLLVIREGHVKIEILGWSLGIPGTKSNSRMKICMMIGGRWLVTWMKTVEMIIVATNGKEFIKTSKGHDLR